VKPRLRVLTLIDCPVRIGGAEFLAATISMRLDRRRFEPTLCSTRICPGPTFEAELRAAGVRVLSLSRRTRGDVMAWRPLLALLRRERIDILHAHKFGSNVWGTVLGRLAGVPVVIAHEHTWSFKGHALRRLLDRELIARFADVFLAVSREDRRRMIEIEGIDPQRIRYIPNGIEMQTPSGTDVRAELGIPPTSPVVGSVGVLRPQKALAVLVKAAALLTRRFPQLRVLIVGTGPEEEKLRALVGRLGLTETVLFLGRRSDVPDLLAAVDLAVCCSDYEGSPLAVLEYMAAGKPVVATRVGGIPDQIEDGVHGLLVDPRDEQRLAEAVEALLLDSDRRVAMGARARERQRREFDLDVLVRRLEALYEELFATSGRARR
jgi:glycosyltransferase involved in cell wall biosynthesis